MNSNKKCYIFVECFLKKNTILFSKYFNFYLNARKNNVVIKKSTYKNLSLNVKIQTLYTAKLEFCTLYDEKDLKRTMFLKNNILFMINFTFYFYLQKFEL